MSTTVARRGTTKRTTRKRPQGGARPGSGARSLFSGKRKTPYGMLFPESIGRIIDTNRRRLTREAGLARLLSRADLLAALSVLHAHALTADDLTRAIETHG